MACSIRRGEIDTAWVSASPAIAGEAVAAQDVYLQAGAHPPEAYQQVQALAAQWLQRDCPNFRGVNLSLVKCIDFADCAAVAAIPRRTSPAASVSAAACRCCSANAAASGLPQKYQACGEQAAPICPGYRRQGPQIHRAIDLHVDGVARVVECNGRAAMDSC